MGIIKNDEIICWQDEDGRLLCNKCANINTNTPKIESDFDDEDVIICDECNERIE